MQRRKFVAYTTLSPLLLNGCGETGVETPAPVPTPAPVATDRVTGWTQMPVADYNNLPPISAGNFPFDSSYSSFDMSDSAFLAQIGAPTLAPPIGDQGQLGSCTAWAVGYTAATQAIRYSTLTPGIPTTLANPLSPADLYAKILRRQAFPCASGTTISVGMDVIVQEGVTTLDNSPYSDRQCSAPQSTRLVTIDGYSKVAAADLYSIRGSIQSFQPVAFGIQVNESFQRLNATNNVFTPDGTGGGHALSIIGYSDARQQYKVMNSWSTQWGSNGFFWISYASFAQFARDVCIPFLRVDRLNRLLTASTSNSSSPIVGQHMYARPYGAGIPGSYGVGVEMGWSAPLTLNAATISVLDASKNILFTRNFSVSQIARGLRFGGSLPDGSASYTYVNASVTGRDSSNRLVTLSTLTQPYTR